MECGWGLHEVMWLIRRGGAVLWSRT